ncbi:hypothetical protein QR680_017239 [Steinernema hermaphroditum]|uniref:IBB domain-containing protein n=1 Tax=Steinernema hermaphroditum TaxID=289476 RepID=A0AA39LNB3_9BILA|nr:hypothetical protein QR680_017239 [Steinernema hermaphroditum]
MDFRKSMYKNNDKTADTLRENRFSESIRIRKDKREALIAARRDVGPDLEEDIATILNGNLENSASDELQHAVDKVAVIIATRDPVVEGFIALGLLAKVCNRSDDHTQIFLDAGLLSMLKDFLASIGIDSIREGDRWMRCEIVRILASVLGGSASQIERVIDSGLLLTLVRMLETEDNLIEHIAIEAIRNATRGESTSVFTLLMECEIIKHLCAVLSRSGLGTIELIMNTVLNLLYLSEAEYATVCTQMEMYGGVHCVEELSYHDNDSISTLALELLEQHLCPDIFEDEEFTMDDKECSGSSEFRF